MEKKNNIPNDTTSLIHIESLESPGNVPVNSASEKYPSIVIEMDEVRTETGTVDNINEGKVLCSVVSSNDQVGSKEDQKSKPYSLPKSPNDRKMVSFADDKGLDLEAVRHFRKHVLPKISNSAFADLDVSHIRLHKRSPRKAKGKSKTKHRTFIPLFHQPGSDPHFFRRLRDQKVCLENILIDGPIVKGIIRVSNLGFEKQVQVCYTTNDWKTKSRVTAGFVSSYRTDKSDRFEFVINSPFMPVHSKLVFAIQYEVNGSEYWDNNYGHDYALDCVEDC